MADRTQASALSPRKAAVRDLFDHLASERDRWIQPNSYFYDEDRRYMRFLVSPGLRVLDLGCGTGGLLAALEPARGVGVDLSEGMIRIARDTHPELEFHVGDVEDPSILAAIEGPFDVIVLSDLVGLLEDCETTFASLHVLGTRETRFIVAYYSAMWEPLLSIAEAIGQKMPQMKQNWLSTEDTEALLGLADFEIIRREWRQLLPKRLLGLGTLVNRFIGTLPIVRRFCLRNYLVARSLRDVALGSRSASVIVPCRNERGNVEAAVTRLPRFAEKLEIIFVEGHSVDGTLEEIHRVIADYPDRDIKVFQQDGAGKADAVWKGFDEARGDILMILDGDLTMPPEWLPRFYDALVAGKGEFANGSRLVYPMEKQAMRFLNMAANRIFSVLFTWLLNQRFTDTLCGTKVLSRAHYRKIVDNRAYFGDFDPFGDFDLIFGAAKLNLKVIEVPVRYASRTYGQTQIARFRHGWLLLRMVVFAYFKLKAL